MADWSRIAPSLALVLFGLACANGNSGAPPPAAPSSLPIGRILSGVVSERGPEGIRPLAGTPVEGWIQQASGGWFQVGPSSTDAEGRYRVSGLPEGFAVLYAAPSGYVQPCAAAVTLLGGEARLDIEVVAGTTLASGARPPIPQRSPTLTGVVFETTAEGKQPVAEAQVQFDWVSDLVTATSKTDDQGRYLLCGLPLGRVDVWAFKGGYDGAFRKVDFQRDTVLDIEVTRR